MKNLLLVSGILLTFVACSSVSEQDVFRGGMMMGRGMGRMSAPSAESLKKIDEVNHLMMGKTWEERVKIMEENKEIMPMMMGKTKSPMMGKGMGRMENLTSEDLKKMDEMHSKMVGMTYEERVKFMESNGGGMGMMMMPRTPLNSEELKKIDELHSKMMGMSLEDRVKFMKENNMPMMMWKKEIKK